MDSLGDISAGDKLTSTIKLTGVENESGELTGIETTRSTKLGETPISGPLRGFYPGLGDDQNKAYFGQTKNGDGTLASYGLNFE